MSKALVVVESPAKAKTIEKFLGKNYTVKASMGHLRDLPKSQFGVNIEHGFEPKYINIRGKGELIKSLKEAAKNADTVYLATDPDREGEAIAWHLAHILNIPENTTCRIEFNEITKPAIQQAVKKPRPINLPRVYAQQARRILDRIVGYKLSPLLWRKVRKGLSAGRVQSVAVRLICDREKEIQAFIPEEYWTIIAKLKEKTNSKVFDAALVSVDGKKLNVTNEVQAEDIVGELNQAEYVVSDVKKRERKRNPYPPFTTSSLQQEASRKLGFTSRKTMMVAQQLYEGLDIGRAGQVGLITYMRTDSTRVSETAQQEAKTYIENKFGLDYLPDKPPVYANKKSQDAHEAVRPTTLDLPPDAISKNLAKDQLKLYTLIWERFIASQMTPAVYDTLTIEITAGRYKLKATGSQLKFPGFLAAFSGVIGKGKEVEENADSDLDNETSLPVLTPGQVLKLYKIDPKQHFTEPPPRYTEASLVKVLEEKGIGRPSTYAPTIETIVDRGYVERIDKKFQPTELGFVVLDLLKQYFDRIVDVEFTAGMEDKLDDIAEGDASWLGVLEQFYDPFAKELTFAEEAIGHVELPVEVSDTPCENCGQMMVVKQGRYGNFLACPGFPACRNTKPILKDTGVKCPKCSGAIVERQTKRRRVFYGCENYPECDFNTWDMPLKDNCQVCGAFMIRHKYKNGGVATVCSNEACSSRQTSEGKEVANKADNNADNKEEQAKSKKPAANRRKKSG
ncbi:type I DNA topoisomerase [Sporomusa malonica]|uniref:DNA topoisomerase 1 n=1 Tax=Sporomusa malonica TaxID=112901 RepID=A0A1W2B1R2_9FIRM|nr:type I DNA topoisomerase [Sporomusa malonica]SMC66925.1 DNA topoisomerase-1 [Sporomusa malonica]